MLNVKRLDVEDAERLIAGAEAKARDIGVPMCISVVDESGNLIAFKRMDGGKVHSIQVAQDKAFTAASARFPTSQYNAVCQPGMPTFGIHTALGGRISVVRGGLPVFSDDSVVGGIGVSSGTPDQDTEVAQAAIDHWLEGAR